MQNFHPCLLRQKSTMWLSLLNAKLLSLSPFAMCLSLLHFQPCAGSEPDCNCCCLSNKYTYMQLRSPEVTRVNFHLSHYIRHRIVLIILDRHTGGIHQAFNAALSFAWLFAVLSHCFRQRYSWICRLWGQHLLMHCSAIPVAVSKGTYSPCK